MKPEYHQTRFLAPELDQVPARFGVVTACNPDGVTVGDEQNSAATERLRNTLARSGYTFFPVTGCSPDLKHQEPGFGIVYDDRASIVELGRSWHQDAVFLIEDGIVHLVPCGDGDPVILGQWSALVLKPG
jgi:hypothetical protein